MDATCAGDARERGYVVCRPRGVAASAGGERLAGRPSYHQRRPESLTWYLCQICVRAVCYIFAYFHRKNDKLRIRTTLVLRLYMCARRAGRQTRHTPRTRPGHTRHGGRALSAARIFPEEHAPHLAPRGARIHLTPRADAAERVLRPSVLHQLDVWLFGRLWQRLVAEPQHLRLVARGDFSGGVLQRRRRRAGPRDGGTTSRPPCQGFAARGGDPATAGGVLLQGGQARWRPR